MRISADWYNPYLLMDETIYMSLAVSEKFEMI
jgi:hypothetical protein